MVDDGELDCVDGEVVLTDTEVHSSLSTHVEVDLSLTKTDRTRRQSDIKPIKKSIVHQICSGQVIVTLSTAVKELVENSIDAGATSVEIRLIDHGSKTIEVIDNGSGISESNFEGLALKHHTSKLTEFEDLTSISTFGFRGEAISSLCALGKLTVLTKTNDSKQAFRIEYDSRGKLISKSPCARQCGTTVILQDLFSTLPVRHKEFLKNVKREFNKMVNVLYGYCLLNVGVRISCLHQLGQFSQSKVFSVPSQQTLRDRVISLFGSKQVSSLMDIVQTEYISPTILAEYGLSSSVENFIQLEGLISKPHCGRSSADRQFFFVNSRPCEPAKISRLVNEIYHGYERNHYPFVCLHIKTKQENVDVNVTPDKRLVYLQNEKLVYATIKASLQSLFTSASSSFDTSMSQSLSQNSQSLSQSSSGELDSSPSSSSSSQEFTQSSSGRPAFRPASRHSFTTPRSILPSSSQFLPQLSGIGSTNRQNIHSVLQRFVPGKEVSSPPLHSQPYKRPREISNKPAAVKQPKLMDFMKSKNVKFFSSQSSEDNVSAIFRMNDNDANADEDCMIIDSQTVSSPPPSLRGCNVEVEEEDTPTQNQQSQNDCDSCFFSQNSDELQNNDSDSVNSSEVVIRYDDEFKDNVNPNYHKCVDVRVDWKKVKDYAVKKQKEDTTTMPNQFFRKFRAKISAGDNSTAEEELKKQVTKDMFAQMTVIGQFNLGFIVVKHESDLFIIDQHASDEKYNFEMLQATTVLQSQRLISPISLQLTAVSENILIDHLDVFQKNGFEFEIDSTAEPTFRVKLSRIPYSRNYEFGKQDVDELIFMLEDAPEKCFYRPSKVRLMFASRACRKSVMIGTNLNVKTMTEIVHHMGQIEQPWNCPHGRPTLRHLFNLNMLPDIDLHRFNHMSLQDND